MNNISNLEEKIPHKIEEVVCLKCLDRWTAQYPATLLLKNLTCEKGHKGFIIRTGQEII